MDDHVPRQSTLSLHLYPPRATLDAASALIRQSSVPHVPEIVLALREELKRPEPSLQAAADLIARDPAITADLLKLINSPAFGLKVKVNSIPQAASLIGLRRLSHYVTAVAMRRVVAGMGPRVHGVWQDIMEVVEAMVAIAKIVPGLTEEETYLFGILHDIGALIFASRSGDYISQWVLRHGSEPGQLLEYERSSFGLEHGVVAFMMASHWKLPEWLALAMCYHHAPGYPDARDSRTNQLIAVAKASEYLIARSRGTDGLEETDRFCAEALGELNLAEDDWIGLCQQAEAGAFGRSPLPQVRRMSESRPQRMAALHP